MPMSARSLKLWPTSVFRLDKIFRERNYPARPLDALCHFGCQPLLPYFSIKIS